MFIEKSNYEKMERATKILLMISIVIFSVTAFIYLLIVSLQNVYFGDAYNSKFVIPIIPLFTFLMHGCSVIIFSFMLIRKDRIYNKGISLELAALIVTIFISTIFSTVLNLINSRILGTLGTYEANYVSKYLILNNYLNYARIFVPFGSMTFIIGTTIKMVLSLLEPKME